MMGGQDAEKYPVKVPTGPRHSSVAEGGTPNEKRQFQTICERKRHAHHLANEPATNVRNGGQISVRNEILELKVSDAK